MRKLRNKNGERLLLDVAGRKARIDNVEYTAFIDFDKNAEYVKINKIKLVNNP